MRNQVYAVIANSLIEQRSKKDHTNMQDPIELTLQKIPGGFLQLA